MRRRRVSSPSAAKTNAEFCNNEFFSATFFEEAFLRVDMFCDVFRLFIPALTVHANRFQTTRRWNAVKAGFDDPQQSTTIYSLQLKFNQRGRFLRIVDGGINCVGTPAKENNRSGSISGAARGSTWARRGRQSFSTHLICSSSTARTFAIYRSKSERQSWKSS